MTCLNRKRLSLSAKDKAFTEVESGTKPSKVAEKHGFPRNTILTWLLPGKKEKTVAFQSGKVSTKKKNMRIGQNENLEKELFDWFTRMQMNNLPISGTVLKEKAMSDAQELQVEEFHASNGLFE